MFGVPGWSAASWFLVGCRGLLGVGECTGCLVWLLMSVLLV